MPVTFKLSNSAADKAAADLLAVPVFAPRDLGPGTDLVDQALGGTLPRGAAPHNGHPWQTFAVVGARSSSR